MPRPTKLTPEVSTEICANIANGAPRWAAAAAVGVGKSTLQEWILRGRTGGPRGQTELYVDFVDCLEKAEAMAIVEACRSIKWAGFKDWKAAMTWLERRYPEDFSRKERLKHEHSTIKSVKEMTRQELVETIVAGCDPAQREALVRDPRGTLELLAAGESDGTLGTDQAHSGEHTHG